MASPTCSAIFPVRNSARHSIEFVCHNGVAYPKNIHYHSNWRDKTADYGGMFK